MRNPLVTEYLSLVGCSSVLVDSYVDGIIHPLEYAYKMVAYMGQLDVIRGKLILLVGLSILTEDDRVDYEKGVARLAAMDTKLNVFHITNPDAVQLTPPHAEPAPRDPAQVQ